MFIRTFSLLSFSLGLTMAILLLRFSPLAEGAGPKMPLLTALLVSEFGFIVSAVGAVLAVRKILNRRATPQTIMLALGNVLLATGRPDEALPPPTARWRRLSAPCC